MQMPSLERANLISTASPKCLHRRHKISIYVTLDASKFLPLIDLMKKSNFRSRRRRRSYRNDKSKTRIANIYQAGN